MSNEAARKSQSAQETQESQDTVNLTADELRSISGGVFLNMVVEKDKSNKPEHKPHHHHHRHPG
jgi:hypothetical protein